MIEEMDKKALRLVRELESLWAEYAYVPFRGHGRSYKNRREITAKLEELRELNKLLEAKK